jgi:hypothetical protein
MGAIILVMVGISFCILAFFLFQRRPSAALASRLRMHWSRWHAVPPYNHDKAQPEEPHDKDSAVGSGPMTIAQAEEILDWQEANGYPPSEATITANGLIRIHKTDVGPLEVNAVDFVASDHKGAGPGCVPGKTRAVAEIALNRSVRIDHPELVVGAPKVDSIATNSVAADHEAAGAGPVPADVALTGATKGAHERSEHAQRESQVN